MNYPESENSLLCMVQAYITLCSLLQRMNWKVAFGIVEI